MKEDSKGKLSDFARRMGEVLNSDSERQKFWEALQGLAERPRKAVRLNALRAKAREMVEKNGFSLGPAVPWESAAFDCDLSLVKDLSVHPALTAGLLYIQEPGAMEAVALLDPQAGEAVLDLCAAPGGKSTQILERLGQTGWLLSNEFDRRRAETLDALVARHGSARVNIYSMAAEALAEKFVGAFDRVLVDAPCSSESFFAKRREQRNDVSERDVQSCVRKQESILRAGARATKGGGVLVYSTCTYNRDENEAIIESFLREHPDWKLELQQRRWPHIDGVAGGYGARLRKGEGGRSKNIDWQKFPDDVKGLIRHGLQTWKGERDIYAATMASEGGEKVSVTFAQAQAYARGEAIMWTGPERGEVTVTWEGYALGPAKAVEGRLNNLLPKVLRSR